jgi:hypothetical protein
VIQGDLSEKNFISSLGVRRRFLFGTCGVLGVPRAGRIPLSSVLCAFPLRRNPSPLQGVATLLGRGLSFEALLDIILRAACSLLAGRASPFMWLRIPHLCCVE